MKVAHWTLQNNSGMHNVAKSMVQAEQRLGLDSVLVDIIDNKDWESVLDADIHVPHTHFPNALRNKVSRPLKFVWVAHGTPEHVFEGAVDDKQKGYGHGDGVMLMQFWMRTADARVTFWPRHQAIYQTMVDKGTKVHLVPLGVDKEFWAGGESGGKYAGSPSVWTGENPAKIKWPLDLFLLWPWVLKEFPEAKLHAGYLPLDLHRWFFPLVNSNGTSYGGYIGPYTYPHDSLRNIWKSVDFFIGLVRYGDFNRLCLEANAAGAKTISYPGNPYSDYWIPEGDQRVAAQELIRILKGDASPREKEPVPDFMDTAKGMKEIYEGIL